ncbi:MAG: flippase [Flavobacteriales bacterium]|nr:flippase [Flavobacteriales bacterium]
MSSIKKNFIYNNILGVTNIIIPLISFPYISRVLGPEGVGIISFAISLAVTFIVLGSLGIPIYGIREIAKSRGDKTKLSNAFLELLIIEITWSLFVTLIYACWLFFTNTYQNENAIKYLSFIHIMSSVGLINWFYQGMEKYKFISIMNFIVKIFTLILLFALVKKIEDYWIYYAIIVISTFISAIVSILYSFRFIQFEKIKLNFKKHFNPIIILFSTQIAISIYVNLDVIMLKYFSQLEQVGYYSAALKIVKMLLIIVTSLGVVLIPRISSFIQENKTKEVKSLIEKSINYVSIISFPTMVILWILSENIIRLFAGIQFTEANYLIKGLSPLIFIVGMTNIFGLQILVPMDKEKKYMIAVLIGLFTNIFFNILLIPIIQAKGAVIATLFTEVIVLLISYYYSKKLISFSLSKNGSLKYLLLSLLFVPLSMILSKIINNEALYLFVFIALCVVIYTLALLKFKDSFFMNYIFNPIYNNLMFYRSKT